MKKEQQRRGNRQEREMRALMKKTQKKIRKDTQEPEPQQEEAPRKARYRDVDGERDWDLKDIDADRLFKEMKRREFRFRTRFLWPILQKCPTCSLQVPRVRVSQLVSIP